MNITVHHASANIPLPGSELCLIEQEGEREWREGEGEIKSERKSERKRARERKREREREIDRKKGILFSYISLQYTAVCSIPFCSTLAQFRTLLEFVMI